MVQRYSAADMERILGDYRHEADTLEIIARQGLPTGVTRMVLLSERWQFVRDITFSRSVGGAAVGRAEEVHYMCEEFFRFAGGRLQPEDERRPFYEFSIDLILDAEESPYIMITADDVATQYVRGKTTELETMTLGEIRRTPKTWFTMYEGAKLVEGIEFSSVEVDGTGYRISTITQDP